MVMQRRCTRIKWLDRVFRQLNSMRMRRYHLDRRNNGLGSLLVGLYRGLVKVRRRRDGMLFLRSLLRRYNGLLLYGRNLRVSKGPVLIMWRRVFVFVVLLYVPFNDVDGSVHMIMAVPQV
jgi:hypothetical protein